VGWFGGRSVGRGQGVDSVGAKPAPRWKQDRPGTEAGRSQDAPTTVRGQRKNGPETAQGRYEDGTRGVGCFLPARLRGAIPNRICQATEKITRRQTQQAQRCLAMAPAQRARGEESQSRGESRPIEPEERQPWFFASRARGAEAGFLRRRGGRLWRGWGEGRWWPCLRWPSWKSW
jgi:hypothetical protein